MVLRPLKQAFYLLQGRVRLFTVKRKYQTKTLIHDCTATLSRPQFSLEQGLSENFSPILGRVWTLHHKGELGITSWVLIGCPSGQPLRKLVFVGLSFNFDVDTKRIVFTKNLHFFLLVEMETELWMIISCECQSRSNTKET